MSELQFFKKKNQKSELRLTDLTPEALIELLQYLQQNKCSGNFSDGHREYKVKIDATITLPGKGRTNCRVKDQLHTLEYGHGSTEHLIRKAKEAGAISTEEFEDWNKNHQHLRFTASRVSRRVREFEELDKNPQLTDNWKADDTRLVDVCLAALLDDLPAKFNPQKGGS